MFGARTYICALIVSYGLVYSTRNQLSSGSAYLFDAGVINPAHFAIMETCRSIAIFITRFGAGFLLDRIGLKFSAWTYCATSLLLFLSYGMLGVTTITNAGRSAVVGTLISAFCVIKTLSSFSKIVIYAVANGVLGDMSITSKQAAMSRLSIALQVVSNLGDAVGKVSFGAFLKARTQSFQPRWGWAMLFTSLADLAAAAVTVPLLFSGLIRSRTVKRLDASLKRLQRLPFRVTPRFVLVVIIGCLNSLVGTLIGSYMTHFMRYSLDLDAADVASMDAITPILNIVTILSFGKLMNLVRTSRHRLVWTVVLPGLLSMLAAGCLYYWNAQGCRKASLIALFAHHALFCPYQTIIDGAYLLLIVDPDSAATAVGISSGLGYLVSIAIPFVVVNHTTTKAGWQHLLRYTLGLKAAAFVPLLVLYVLDSRRTKAA